MGDEATHKRPNKLSDHEREAAQRRAREALETRVDTRQPGVDDPFLRAANEDDDGYDPYSDRPEKTSRYEEDPWR